MLTLGRKTETEQLIFLECLLCAKPWAHLWGYRGDNTEQVLNLMEFITESKSSNS